MDGVFFALHQSGVLNPPGGIRLDLTGVFPFDPLTIGSGLPSLTSEDAGEAEPKTPISSPVKGLTEK